MTTTSPYVPLVNGAGSSVVHGEVVRVSAPNTFTRAQADSGPHLAGLIGVNGSGTIGVGGSANIFTTGALVDVLLETGLTPAAGDAVYVSAAVAGRGTNVPPGTAVQIGVIETAAQYATTGIVQVALKTSGSSGGGGAQGAQGFQGTAGAQGLQGLQGLQGFQGTAGAQGNQGLQGATGSGAQGAQGFQGLQGSQGSQGSQGFQGFQGINSVTTDSTMTGDGTVGSPLHCIPTFGSDTLVQLPNGVSTPVNALELIASLTTSTAGAEVSQWLIKLLNAGAQVTALTVKPNATQFPVGTTALARNFLCRPCRIRPLHGRRRYAKYLPQWLREHALHSVGHDGVWFIGDGGGGSRRAQARKSDSHSASPAPPRVE